MPNPGVHSIQLAKQNLQLHPFGAAYWTATQTLLLADLHLGKAQHFRKAGIPVPLGVSDANLDKLTSLLLDFQPQRVLFLGDLFHSEYNRQWHGFCELLAQFPKISFELIQGNHDILDGSFYQQAGLKLHVEGLVVGPFWLTHHPEENYGKERPYNLAGHLHPGIRLRGRGRQHLRLPCFFFGQNQGLLPAFGEFTGLATIQAGPDDRVFAIAEDEVIPIG